MVRNGKNSEDSPYLLPRESSVRGWYCTLLMRFTYDIWRRELQRWQDWAVDSKPQILECGCGPGFLLKFSGEWFPRAKLLGLDVDAGLLKAARECSRGTAGFLVASAEEIPLSNASLDVLVALHMVEHLTHPLGFLDEAQRVLRSGALFIVATPNPLGIGASVMGHRWHGWRDDHVSLHTPDYWRAALEQRRFHILRDGTTGISGIPVFRILPIALIQWVPLFIHGFFSWKLGESYIAIASKWASG